MGVSIFLNGGLSYMGDVATWGRWSWWKAADVLFAVSNTLLQMVIVALAALGLATFPPASPLTLGVSVAIALACKSRAQAARQRGDCLGFLRWHSAWHYSLPLGAGIASQLLIVAPNWGEMYGAGGAAGVAVPVGATTT